MRCITPWSKAAFFLPSARAHGRAGAAYGWCCFQRAVLALGLGGLPLTGGALAKLAVEGTLGDGVVGTLATLSAVASTVLMLHFLHRLTADAPANFAARRADRLRLALARDCIRCGCFALGAVFAQHRRILA